MVIESGASPGNFSIFDIIEKVVEETLEEVNNTNDEIVDEPKQNVVKVTFPFYKFWL